MPFYDFPRPAFTVDVVLFHRKNSERHVLLIQRGQKPFKGCWALPGGFVEENEPPLAAARRELLEETGLQAGELRHFSAFGDPGRDPRGWTLTMAFAGEITGEAPPPTAADDAAAAGWFDLNHLPDLAFDHLSIIKKAVDFLNMGNLR